MNRTALRASLVGTCIAVAALVAETSASGATACADLKNLKLPDTQITTAERVAAGNFTPPGGGGAPGAPGGAQPLKVPAMCRVAGTISPAVNFEVWLPEGAAWNKRLQTVGGGGLAGIISYPAMSTAVNAGFASASTDTGHVASDTTVWVNDRRRVIDYGYRAIHQTTVKAKALIEAHYGAAQQFAYFNGCSTGGRQGLMEAQRYPEDYDGIVSGAPVNTFTRLHMGQLWTAHATVKADAALDAKDFALVSKTVLEQCDMNDGVKDDVLTDPRTCHFDPSVLQCQSSRTSECLSAEKVGALKKIYAGAVNPRTGVQVYAGLEPGGEYAQPRNPGWGMIMNGKGPFFIDTPVLGGMGFQNPNWDWKSFDFDRDVELVDSKLAGILNAVDPDLRDFKSHGGKLIVYHGWSDPGVMPKQTLHYYDNVVTYAAKATGGDGKAFTDDYLRLFMMPGMGHCGGGNGPDQADWMGALMGWREHGMAPTTIVARKEENGKVTETRPLCMHPQVARYKGKGDTNDAANFECAAPK